MVSIMFGNTISNAIRCNHCDNFGLLAEGDPLDPPSHKRVCLNVDISDHMFLLHAEEHRASLGEVKSSEWYFSAGGQPAEIFTGVNLESRRRAHPSYSL